MSQAFVVDDTMREWIVTVARLLWAEALPSKKRHDDRLSQTEIKDCMQVPISD